MIICSYYKYGIIKLNHIWFCNENPAIVLKKNKLKGISIFHDAPEKITKNGLILDCNIKKFNTLITNLNCSEEELYQMINKNYRYEIRRAEKENVEIKFLVADEILGNKSILNTFVNVYEEMYRDKGLNKKFNKEIVNMYIKRKAIIFSIAYINNLPLVFHSYVFDDTNTRFLYSASPIRNTNYDNNMVGRMNKYLHWKDIQYFKKKGIVSYDWGGISTEKDMIGITQFKKSFGGIEHFYYNLTICKPLLYRIYNYIKNAK